MNSVFQRCSELSVGKKIWYELNIANYVVFVNRIDHKGTSERASKNARTSRG